MKVYKKCIICLTVAAMLIFSSCSITAKPLQSDDGKNSTGNVKLNTTDITSNILKKLDKAMSLDDIWADVADVDLGLVLEDNTDGLTAKDKVDKDNPLTCYYYDKDNNVVFIDYVGHGEDIFKHFTKSKSGLELTVSYDDFENGKRDISISSEKYRIEHSYYSIAKDADNSQCEISVFVNGVDGVTIDEDKDIYNDFEQYIVYSIKGDAACISKALYYDDDGYHEYSNDVIDEKHKPTEYDEVRCKKVDSVNTDNKILTLVNDKRVLSSEINNTDCQYRFEYALDQDGNKQWYLNSCIYNVFDNQATAEEYARDYGLKAEKSETYEEGDYWIVKVENALLPADIPFKDIWWLVINPNEDNYFGKITLSSDGRLTGLDSDNTILKATYVEAE